MQVAIIAPTTHLELSEAGDFYFVLAQRVLEDDHYRHYYANIRSKNKFVMLDNGAFERGKSLPIDSVLEAADLVDATEVVAPDFPMRGEESFRMTVDFLSVCPPKYKIVALPHGRNALEFISFYDKVSELPIDVIGLSVIFHKQCGGIRPHVYHYLKSKGAFSLIKKHHLFGLDSLTELWCYAPGDVRSVDTSLPISLAYENEDLPYLDLPAPHQRVPETETLNKYELWRARNHIEELKTVARCV